MNRVCYYKGCGVVYGEKKPLSDKSTTYGLCPKHLRISLKKIKAEMKRFSRSKDVERRISINIKEGDIFKKSSDGVDFAVKKIVNDMAVLESEDRRRQVLTEVNTLKLKSFYLKEAGKDL